MLKIKELIVKKKRRFEEILANSKKNEGESRRSKEQKKMKGIKDSRRCENPVITKIVSTALNTQTLKMV